MSRRLASFSSPSIPTSSPVHHPKRFYSQAPSFKSYEFAIYRKLRIHLQELRAATESWDDLVLIDGVKAAKNLIEARTELEDEIFLSDHQPRYPITGTKLAFMDKCMYELQIVTKKLNLEFQKMNSTIENMEALMVEGHKVKGWRFVAENPLWLTWTLEKFVSSASSVLIPYHRSLHHHFEIVDVLRDHSVSFEDSKTALSKWISQPELGGRVWNALWEDICGVEVEIWQKSNPSRTLASKF